MNILLSPPVSFVVILATIFLFSAGLSKLSTRRQTPSDEQGASYACGEDVPTHLMQPDYSQFFPFAFFFTILHVVALMITTIPVTTMSSFAIAVLYIAGALVSIMILFRR